MRPLAGTKKGATGRAVPFGQRVLSFQTKATGASKRGIRILAQLVLILGVYAAGCALASVAPITLPGNIVGMVLLLVLLGTGLLKTKYVSDACEALIDNMSIFFIPAGVAIMGCFSLLEGNAAKFALVCIVTTVLVFLATSYTVIAVSRLLERKSQRRTLAKNAAQTTNAQDASSVKEA